MMKSTPDSEIEMHDVNGDTSTPGNDEHEALLIPGGADDGGSTKKRAATSTKTKVGDPGSPAMDLSTRRKLRKAAKAENATAVFIKYAALFLLVAQMVGLVLIMRYSRTHSDPDQPLYLASTAVFMMEVMKLVLCLVVIAYQTGTTFLSELYQHTLGSPVEIIKLCVPSLLYTVQNNLLYLALTNLDAATYQVCYQLKILTTALFSAVLLQRKFSAIKWISLIVLTVGVAIVQISGSGDQHSTQAVPHHHDAEHPLHDAQHQHREVLLSATDADAQRNRFVGLAAVLFAACTSGFSGVYFEKILKGSTTSLWIRNVQMGLPSILIAYATVYTKDAVAVQSQGFLGGYTAIVWTVVTVQAVGGLIVATVVKYADNVLKVFATSFSIVVSCVISAFLFDFHPNISFLVGASLVVIATVMYSAPDAVPKKRKTVLPMATRRTK